MDARTLRDSLMQSFPTSQASVLADAFTDAFASQERVLDELGALRREVTRVAEAQGRTELALQMLARQVGGLSDKLGGSLEDLAVETVPAVLAQEWGLEGIACGRETFLVAGKEEEVDLVLRGSRPDGTDLLVLGEVKSRLTEREVEHFLGRVERIRPTLPIPQVRVLFFGFQIGLDARRLVRDAGAYFLFSNGRFLKTL